MRRSLFGTAARLGDTVGGRAGLVGALVAGGWAAFAGPPALAQPAGGESQLEEVVVTARKVEENLQDVPVAVTAFSGQQLAQQNAVRISDVARLAPGLTLREGSNNPSGVILSLRAQVQTDQLATLDPSVGTYVDGFYWARAYGLNADLLDVESVQVLKGPQGTLFGRNTTGGALLIETNDPNPSGVAGMLQGTYGRFDERVVTGMLNLPLVEDRAAIRVAVQQNQRDGYLKDARNGRRYTDRDNLTARMKLLLQPTEDLQMVFSGEIFNTSQVGPAQALVFIRQPVVASATQPAFASTGRTFVNLFPIPGLTLDQYLRSTTTDENAIALSDRPYTDVKTRTYTGTLKYDTPVGALKLVGGYRHIEALSDIDLDGSPWQIHVTGSTQELEHWSTEAQLTGDALGGAISYAAGAFYFSESGIDRSLGFQVPGLSFLNNQFYGDIDNDSKGAYGQVVWHATDALNLTGGIRYSQDRKGIEVRNLTYDRRTNVPVCTIAGAVAPTCSLKREDKFDGVSYTAGVDYDVAPDVLIYAKTSKGFRSGGQNLRATSLASFVPFKPEVVFEHEAGFKSQFLDRRVRLNVAAYRSTLKNAQRTTLRIIPQTGGTTTVLENAARVRIWGAEAEAAAILFDGFEVSATGALTKAKYLRYLEAPSPQNPTGDRRRERFDAVPKHTFSLAAMYRRNLDFGRLLLRADYSWQGKTPLNAWNNPLDPNNAGIVAATTQPSGGAVNARAALAFSDDRYEVAVWGRNLANNRDINNALFVDPFGYVAVRHREPRTYGVTLTARFGNP